MTNSNNIQALTLSTDKWKVDLYYENWHLETKTIEKNESDFVIELSEKHAYSFKPEFKFLGKQIEADKDHPIHYGIELEYSLRSKKPMAVLKHQHKEEEAREKKEKGKKKKKEKGKRRKERERRRKI